MNFGDCMYGERKDLTDGEKQDILWAEFIHNSREHCSTVVKVMINNKYPSLTVLVTTISLSLTVVINNVVIDFNLGEMTTPKGFSEFEGKIDQTVAQINSQ